MSTSPTVSELNRDVARKINGQVRDNPQSPFAGKFVGLLGGHVVAVADDLDELVQRLRWVVADPRQSFCFEAELDYGQVQEIWGLR
jgi:hypothetical protein